jgi:hypothetical protein
MKNIQQLGLKARSWRYLVNAWTVFLFVVVVWDFMTNNGLGNVIGAVAAIYTGALAIYSVQKEFERWSEYYAGRHPGEWYVIAWTLLMVLVFSAEIVLRKPYTVPHEIIATYIAVISILAITRKSKTYYYGKRRTTPIE